MVEGAAEDFVESIFEEVVEDVVADVVGQLRKAVLGVSSLVTWSGVG
jgi:hypothetical protein